jgi:LuxR family transcriptional regulator, maltose regulon positive regulatory protein
VIGKTLGINEDWERLMEMVMRNNVFVLPVGEDHLWLRYHHLFRDFLQERLHRDEPHISEKIENSLAEYFIRKQDWDKSFSIYQKLNRMEELACLVEKVGSDFIAMGRMNKLAEWLNVLDEQAVKRHPAVTALQASVAVNKGNPQDGLVFFDKLVGTLQSTNQTELLADNLVRRSSTRRVMGDYSGSIEDADKAIKLCQDEGGYVLIMAEAMRAKGSTFFQQGKWNEALNWLEQSLKIYRDNNRSQDIARIQVEIGAVADALGNYSAAEKSYQESLRYWQSIGDSMWQANLLNNLGFLQHSIGEYETAFTNLEKALQYANLNGNLRMEGYSLASIGDLYRDLEAYQEAEDAFQKASQIAKLIKDSYLYFYVKLAQARVQIDLGRFRQAETIFRSALQLAKLDGSKNEMNKYRLENGLLQLFLRNFSKAIDELSNAAQYFESENHPDDLIRAQFLLAVAAYENGAIEQSIELFKNANSRLNQPRARVKILTSACELETLLNGILEKKDVGETLEVILNEMEGFRNRIHDSCRQIRKRATAVSFTPPKIILRAFGKTEVSINNHKLTNAEWKSQNARDLLFLFLCHTGGLTKEEVGLNFWPDLSPIELKLRFKNAVYRLRHAAGNDIVVFHDNYYLFNRALDYEYDVHDFSNDLEYAEAEKNVLKKISHLQSAISKYGGAYLSDVEEDWPAADRRKYADQYLRALLELSTIFYRQKDYEKARDIIQITLAADDCSEEAYRLGMQIYSAMGNMGEVKRIYQKCVDSLRTEMGIPPSARTRQIFENLTILKIEKMD